MRIIYITTIWLFLSSASLVLAKHGRKRNRNQLKDENVEAGIRITNFIETTESIETTTLQCEDETTTPRCDEVTTTPPCKEEDITTTPPCKEEATTTTPCKEEDTTTTPCKEEDTTTTPCKEEDTTTTPCKEEATTTTPCKEEATTTPPCKEEDTTTPRCEEETTTPPCKEADTTTTPCKAEDITTSKTVKTTQLPVLTTAKGIDNIPDEPDIGKIFLNSTSNCKKYANGIILLDPKHCRRYFICENGRAKLTKCARNNWYDYQVKGCRPESDVKNCDANRC